MKKMIVALLMISLPLFGAAPLGDAVETPDVNAIVEPAQVGKASDASASAARSRTWQNIGIATAAVAVAVVALILVHNNPGHSSSK